MRLFFLHVLKYFVLACWLICAACPAQAQTAVAISDARPGCFLGPEVETWIDAKGTAGIGEVLARHQADFRPSGMATVNFGYTPSACWIRLSARNESSEPLYLQVGSPSVDSLSCYAVMPDGRVIASHAGIRMPFNDRHPKFALPTFQIPNEATSIYLRARSADALQLPLHLGTVSEIVADTQKHDVLTGLLAGIVAFMFCYSVVNWLMVRDLLYLYYLPMLVASGSSILRVGGHDIWLMPWLTPYWGILVPMLSLASLPFCLRFLEISWQRHKGLFLLMCAAYACLVPSMAMELAGMRMEGNQLMAPVLFLVMPITFGAAIWVYAKGHKPAVFFALAYFFLMAGVMAILLLSAGLLPHNAFTDNAFAVGAALQVTLFTLAIGDRRRRIKRAYDALQREAVAQAEAHARELEDKVNLRTAELYHANEELRASEEELRQNLEELQATQEALELRGLELQDAFAEAQHQKHRAEKKNADIMSSLQYAKRIQEALLPSNARFSKAFPQSFVFYLPRDVVSGDFYWVHQSERYLYVAAIDCTGHGVPGAFMSLIGSALLREAVINLGATSPGDILEIMHRGLISRLNQQENQSRDGMEGGVCVIDKERMVLQFAGARQPLIYFKEGRFFEIPGDKSPLGMHQKRIVSQFTTHEVALDQPVRCYLFSDGYQDQFGQATGRKFLSSRLRRLLIDAQPLAFPDQKRKVEHEFHEWKGQERQLDDVMMLGFEVGPDAL